MRIALSKTIIASISACVMVSSAQAEAPKVHKSLNWLVAAHSASMIPEAEVIMPDYARRQKEEALAKKLKKEKKLKEAALANQPTVAISAEADD